MERLTHKIVYDNEHKQYVFSYNQECEVGTKLGELEDVLEKYGIDDAKQLDNMINSIRTNTLIDMECKEILELENANLKSELAELKQKAIVPKFKVGQEIYYIYGNEIRSMFVSTIEISKNLIGYHSLRDFAQLENNCFATKEEAEQKLTELKGEKDE